MTIECINNESRFFQDVKTLGKRNSATLGFMPEGGFEDHAQNKWIIVACIDDTLCGYLMFREVPRYSRVSIVHLCIDENHRGRGITQKLLDHLRSLYEYNYSYNGISLSCRNDYIGATSVWQKYGFVSKTQIRSRSVEENYLNKWWYDFNRQDLFSLAATQSKKIRALLDANIIIKLRDIENDYAPMEDPRCLLSDWLIDETEFLYASEIFNEINRDKDRKRAQRTRGFINHFVEAKHNIEDRKRIAQELEEFITGHADNDNSDRIQLATCIAAGVRYFITFDQGILDAKEAIESNYDVEILTPQEFVLFIDKLIDIESYSPKQILGAVFHSLSKIVNKELELCIDKFWDQKGGENKKQFRNSILKVVNSSSYIIDTVKYNNENIALFAYKNDNSVLSIPIIRISDAKNRDTLFMGLVNEFISRAIKEKCHQIRISESNIKERYSSILLKFGFIIQDSSYVKHVIDECIASDELGRLIKQNNIPILDELIDQSQLLDIERKLFPLKITDIDIPCYIIPIKAVWAAHLFDKLIASESLFGADVNRLWNVENVYYRSTKPITEKCPARILWYVSFDKNSTRSKAIVACSYLNEVVTGLPKDVFRRYKHYGIYEWKHVYNLCNKDINSFVRALKFSQTQLFEKPIDYSTVTKIIGTKNTFASPVRISKDMYSEIYKLGHETK